MDKSLRGFSWVYGETVAESWAERRGEMGPVTLKLFAPTSQTADLCSGRMTEIHCV